MGFYTSLQACFTIHTLNHSHWGEVAATDGGNGRLPGGWKTAGPPMPALVGKP
jgi:enoyl-CoA hydratase